MIQFGGTFLPVHFVGALVEGRGAGRRLEPQLPGRGSATAGATSSAAPATPATTTTSARRWSEPVLEAGSALRPPVRRLASTSTRSRCRPTREFGERIVAGHVVWQKEDPELIAEVAARPARAARTSRLHVTNHAYYVQAAYRLPQLNRLLEAVLPLRAHRRSTRWIAVFARRCRISTARRWACGYDIVARSRRSRARRATGAAAAPAAQLRRLLSDLLHVLMADAPRPVPSCCDGCSPRPSSCVLRVRRRRSPRRRAPATSPSSCIRTCRSTTSRSRSSGACCSAIASSGRRACASRC